MAYSEFHRLNAPATEVLALFNTMESSVFSDVKSAQREYPGTLTTCASSSYVYVIPFEIHWSKYPFV